jgi:hypothetical protein
MSYDFYVLLRIVVWAVAGHTAWLAYSRKPKFWQIWLRLLGGLAVLFNPIAPFYLSRETWRVLDGAAVGVLLLSIPFVTGNRREGTIHKRRTLRWHSPFIIILGGLFLFFTPL